MYHEFATDPVTQSLSFEDQRHYMVILCLKCNGVIDRPISKANKERIIRQGLGVDDKTLEKIRINLSELNLIDKNWQPNGWGKRQFVSDHSSQRSRKSRKNKETCNGNEPLQQRDCNVPETETETETDTDTELNNTVPTVQGKSQKISPEPPPVNKSKYPDCPYSKIVGLYHEILPELPCIVTTTPARQTAMKSRWRDLLKSAKDPTEHDGINLYLQYFQKIRESPWLMGQVPPTQGRKQFIADLDFILRQAKFVGVLEGKYEN